MSNVVGQLRFHRDPY